MKTRNMRRLMQVALVVGMIAMSCAANAKTYRAALWVGENTMHGKYFSRLCSKINKATNGDINLEVYPGGTLLPPKGSLPGLQKRVADFANITTPYTPSDFPFDNVLFDLSWFSDDQLADNFASIETKILHPLMLKEDKRLNIVFDAEVSMGIYNYQCNCEIKSLADLKGKKLRTTGAVHVRWTDATDSVSVAVPATEIYTGLQRGSLDCAFGTPLFMTDYFKLIEVVKAVTRLPMGSTNAGGFYFNRDFWKSLSVKERRLILDLSAETNAEVMVEYIQSIEGTWTKAREAGISIIEPDAEMIAKLKAFNEKYKKDLPKLTEKNRNISLMEAKQLINDYLACYDKWKRLLSEIDTKDVAQLTALVKKEIYDKIDAETFGME